METKTNFRRKACITWPSCNRTFKRLVFGVLILTGIPVPILAQMETTIVFEPEVGFIVNSPRNIRAENTESEVFPIRNYVFFNIGSTTIPERYVLLNKDQVKYFKEDELIVATPKNPSDRSGREMIVYYNVLNILGDRMGRNPSTTITLVGLSEKSPEDGWAMARPIKEYLVSVFGIDASRIRNAGRFKTGSRDHLLREEDRKVSIESSWPALLIAFQSGQNASMKTEELRVVQEAPLESYPSFSVAGEKEAFSSWSMEIKDEKGKVQYFGPFTGQKVSIPGKSILGARPEGDYTVTMIGQTKDGNTIKKEASLHMVRWTPPKNEQGLRFSVYFELNQWKAIPVYEKYLTDIVTPEIPKGGTVILHAYPDTMEGGPINQKLALARANNVVTIIESSLLKADRSDVTFEVVTIGEDQNVSPNKFPEDRVNNRTVVIEVMPR